jgi:hypothetical protein
LNGGSCRAAGRADAIIDRVARTKRTERVVCKGGTADTVIIKPLEALADCAGNASGGLPAGLTTKAIVVKVSTLGADQRIGGSITIHACSSSCDECKIRAKVTGKVVILTSACKVREGSATVGTELCRILEIEIEAIEAVHSIGDSCAQHTLRAIHENITLADTALSG